MAQLYKSANKADIFMKKIGYQVLSKAVLKKIVAFSIVYVTNGAKHPVLQGIPIRKCTSKMIPATLFPMSLSESLRDRSTSSSRCQDFFLMEK